MIKNHDSFPWRTFCLYSYPCQFVTHQSIWKLQLPQKVYVYIREKTREKQSKLLTLQPTTEDLAFSTLPVCVSPRLGGECQCCLVWVNAVRCDLITPTYLKVSSRLLARHKIDLHQGQAWKATQAKQALHFEMQRLANTGVGTEHM